MAATIEEILKDSIEQAIGLDRDNIQTDVRNTALGIFNEQGRILWDEWPWFDEKPDEFTAPAPDSNGIITFAATVDVIRAVRAYTTDSDSAWRVWNADEVLATAEGAGVDSGRFWHLQELNGCKRIKVGGDNPTNNTYLVLALSRWVDAVVDPAYDANDPTATPTDYRVLEFALPRVEPALRANVKDGLRKWQGIPTQGAGPALAAIALKREQLDGDVERRANPRAPHYEGLGGGWIDGEDE